MPRLKLEVEGAVVRVLAGGGANPREVSVATLVKRIVARVERKHDSAVLPEGVRAWQERGDSIALAIEYPPALRTVRWVADDTPAPFGREARYEFRRISLPWVIVLAVFDHGALMPLHQLFYRRESLGEGEDLLMPNLLNVAPDAYDLKSWVCLLNLRLDPKASWHEKVRAIGEHVFATGWNLSAERHEGESCFRGMQKLDARVASIEAWEAASRENPRFALEVAWRPAKTTVSKELARMLDMVAPSLPVQTAEDLAGVMGASSDEDRRQGRRPWFL